MSSPGVAVSAMAESNLQRRINYIKHFKRIGRTCIHTDVELSEVLQIYYNRYMEYAHKQPELLHTIYPREFPRTLETVEECVRGFCGVYEKPLRYGLRKDLAYTVYASDPTYCANGSK